MVGVEQWAEIRRLHRVEGISIREISRRTGLHRKTIRRALAAVEPPRYSRSTSGSKLDPFREWICEQLAADPRIQSQRLREMAGEIGYEGGKSIFDDFVRDVRPRFLVPRTFQRTIYRPGELVQCDLWEPGEHIPVGHGQRRRGWVVTCEVCWSRAIAGTLPPTVTAVATVQLGNGKSVVGRTVLPFGLRARLRMKVEVSGGRRGSSQVRGTLRGFRLVARSGRAAV